MPHQPRHSPGIGHRVAAPPLLSSQETWCPLWSPPLHSPQTAVVQVVHHRARAWLWLWHHNGHMPPSAVSTEFEILGIIYHNSSLLYQGHISIEQQVQKY